MPRKIPLLYVLAYKNLLERGHRIRPEIVPTRDAARALSKTAFGLDSRRQETILKELAGMGLILEIRREEIVLNKNIKVPDV